MPLIEIRNHRTQGIICAGEFPSMIECLEKLCREKFDLSGADLSGHNLSNANLDGLVMQSAQLKGANLTGANLSEADLKQSDLRDATLCDTCFCESNLTACDFSGARFGATDIAQAILSGAVFSTLSALDLDFQSAQTMSDCAFIQPDGTALPFGTPPIVIKGVTHTPVIIIGQTVKIGHLTAPLEKTIPLMQALFTDTVGRNARTKGTDFFAFFDNHG